MEWDTLSGSSCSIDQEVLFLLKDRELPMCICTAQPGMVPRASLPWGPGLP